MTYQPIVWGIVLVMSGFLIGTQLGLHPLIWISAILFSIFIAMLVSLIREVRGSQAMIFIFTCGTLCLALPMWAAWLIRIFNK
jgi:hypothetical protein